MRSHMTGFEDTIKDSLASLRDASSNICGKLINIEIKSFKYGDVENDPNLRFKVSIGGTTSYIRSENIEEEDIINYFDTLFKSFKFSMYDCKFKCTKDITIMTAEFHVFLNNNK